jgi:hypothetical protein
MAGAAAQPNFGRHVIMPQQSEQQPDNAPADEAAAPGGKKPCNTLPEVAEERNNDIVERIDVLIDHADIAGPDWIKDVLGNCKQTIVDLRGKAAAQEATRSR